MEIFNSVLENVIFRFPENSFVFFCVDTLLQISSQDFFVAVGGGGRTTSKSVQ